MDSISGSTHTEMELPKTLKSKPLIIKKSSLFKAQSIVFIQQPAKRSITEDGLIVINDSTAKKKCTKSDLENEIRVSIMGKGAPTKTDVHSTVHQNETKDLTKIDALIDDEEKKPLAIIGKVVSESDTMPETVITPCIYKDKPFLKRCLNHKHIPEYEAEGLVQINDEFATIEDFVNYSFDHALQWCFTYNMRGHVRPKVEANRYNKARPTVYGFDCVFHKKCAGSKSKGIRKVNVIQGTSCEARVILRRRYGEDVFKVTQVCHHHDHKLTTEEFLKVPNARRLSPAMKKEIDELLSFDLETQLIYQYVQSKYGMDLRKNVRNRYQVIRAGEGRKILKAMAPEQMKTVLEKIKYIRSTFSIEKKRLPKMVGSELKGKNILVSSTQAELTFDEVDDTSNQDDAWYEQELSQSVVELQKESFETQDHDTSSPVMNQTRQYSSDEDFKDEYGSLAFSTTSTPAALPNPAQTPSSRRGISPEVAAEVRDLAWFGLDAEIIRRHIYFETGKDLLEYIKLTIDEIVNRATEPLEVRQEELDVILEKITQLEDKYGPVENHDWHRDKKIIDDERNAFESLKSTIDSPSRVETRLNNIMSDQQLIDSVEELKRTTGCNIQIQEVDNSQLELEVVDDPEFQCISYENVANDENIIDTEESNPVDYELKDLTVNYELRDIAVQADFELLDLESNYESIQKIESDAISEDLRNSKHSAHTRGQPKVIEEEAIVNKFNIELYISNFTGIASCVENIAGDMNISVIELLKKIYKGEGVFKMIMGRSGQQNRITVQLTYVPLTITFPYEKFKYINSLQEYKAMCSKYLDLARNLEKVVNNLSAELDQVSRTNLYVHLQEEKEKNFDLSKKITQLEIKLQEASQESKALSEELKKLKIRKGRKKIEAKNDAIDIELDNSKSEYTDHNSSEEKDKIDAQSKKIALLQRDLQIALRTSNAQSQVIKKLKIRNAQMNVERKPEPDDNAPTCNENPKKNDALRKQIAQLQTDLHMAIQQSKSRFEEIKLLKMGIKTPSKYTESSDEASEAPSVELAKVKKYLQELVIKNETLAKNNSLLSRRNRELEELRLNIYKIS